MRIILDGGCLTNIKAGIGNYTYSLLTNLLKIDPKNNYSILLPKNNQSDLVFLPILNRLTMKREYYKYLPYDAERLSGRFDLYHETNYIPRHFSGKKVVTICDMSCKIFPEYHPIHRTLRFKLFENRMRNVDRIITISENSRQEIINLLKVPEDRVAVTYLGASNEYKPLTITVEQILQLKALYNIPDQYVLYVGTVEPRKNLNRLIEAFHIFKQESHHPEVKLVIVGGKGWLYDKIFSRIKELKMEKDIIFTGYVQDEYLPFLYNLALAFIYPSIYEGFGLPPLEAMSCGTPVISANTSSIPEVVGDAGLLIDPYNINEIAGALLQVIQSNSLRSEMSRKGLEQAGKFSWEKCASETLKIYSEL